VADDDVVGKNLSQGPSSHLTKPPQLDAGHPVAIASGVQEIRKYPYALTGCPHQRLLARSDVVRLPR